jgi:hypothetical protein
MILVAGILLAQTPPPNDASRNKAALAPRPLSKGSQAFGLKGDVLGETADEFRAHNSLAQCSAEQGNGVQRFIRDDPAPTSEPVEVMLSDAEISAGVRKCIEGIDPTVAKVKVDPFVKTIFWPQ